MTGTSAARRLAWTGGILAALWACQGMAQEFMVRPAKVPDAKAVFGEVRAANVVPARARAAGILASLSVKEGDRIERGQVIAAIADEKIALRLKALDAAIAAAEARQGQTSGDLARAEDLFKGGNIPRARLDDARAAASVAANNLKSARADRAVVDQQLAEGQVLSPATGRVLKVPVTTGTYLGAGESVATVATENYILRLELPERHARFIKAGDKVLLGGADLAAGAAREGRITLVYPEIADGRVVADAEVAGLGDYFVGERVRAYIATEMRNAIIVPAAYVSLRAGVDYVRLKQGDNTVIDVPVVRGRARAGNGHTEGVEILSGLKDGDVLLPPQAGSAP